MSGSLKWVVYESDDSTEYAVFLDESNSEVQINSVKNFEDYEAESNNKILPKYVKMRYANLVRVDAGTTYRKVLPIGKKETYESLATDSTLTITLDSNTWSVSSLRGEKSRRPLPIDTGANDGDAT